ncbi:hypothetical protein LAZ67_18000686 [Cordylochernes scorpioides]|uniref:Uncharacterized protein n=1 Tax=Cordylochernes scorpioides TaxID=51811 RepID=A0ABY6LIU8_9ARAC|nr:hypothetical protein LAZ67_18000686 [Cordylochernes scorpioides]
MLYEFSRVAGSNSGVLRPYNRAQPACHLRTLANFGSNHIVHCTITARNAVVSQASNLMGLLERAIAFLFTRGLVLVSRARAVNSLILGFILQHLHGYVLPEIGRRASREERTDRVSEVASSS